jgi:hypothetical protein
MKKLTLTIIASFSIFSCSNRNQENPCLRCQTGTFTLYDKFANDTISVERNDSIQIETNLKSRFITKSKIMWRSDCEFDLVFISSTDSFIDSIPDSIKKKPLETRIIKVERDWYVFESGMKGVKQKLIDTMWFQMK